MFRLREHMRLEAGVQACAKDYRRHNKV